MSVTINDYSQEDQELLKKAWTKIESALEVYKEITGAEFIDDVVHEAIWQAASAADKDPSVKSARESRQELN